MCAGGFWEKLYMEFQCMIPYIEATYMGSLKIHLDIDLTRVWNIIDVYR